MLEYSKNKRAEKICGKRMSGVSLDQPSELGYVCPNQKEKVIFTHEIYWSEYNFFIWCEDCNWDFPSVICKKTVTEQIKIFLDIIKLVKEEREHERKGNNN